MGKVRLNQVDRTITFPAVVNLREGPIEYLVVTDYGKIHESVFRTDIAPYHLQLALLLLLGEPAPPSIPPDAQNSSDGRAEGVPPPSSVDHQRPRLSIEIVWKTTLRTRRAPAGSFVQNRRTLTNVDSGRWIYVGSRFRETGFAAQADGSLIALIEDPDALVGNALPGADDDDNWLAVGRGLPQFDQPVKIVITELHQPQGGTSK